jgi:hypothetical protein
MLGTQWLHDLAVMVRERGINVFEAEVKVRNQDMLRVLKNSGYQLVQELESGVCRSILDITPSAEAKVSPGEGRSGPRSSERLVSECAGVGQSRAGAGDRRAGVPSVGAPL